MSINRPCARPAARPSSATSADDPWLRGRLTMAWRAGGPTRWARQVAHGPQGVDGAAGRLERAANGGRPVRRRRLLSALGRGLSGVGSAFSPLRLPAPARLLLRACSPRRVFPFLPCLWRRPRLGFFLAMSRATDPPVAAWPAGPAAGSVRPPAPASQLRQLRHQSGCRHDLSSPVVAACKQRSCTGDVRRGRRGLWAAPPSERDDNGMWGGVNIADARSLASAWRGSSRQTVMSGPRGMACWGRALGTRYVRGGAVCGWLSLTTRRVWDWGRSELRRHAQPGVRLAGGVQADPNVWRAGVACWRRALGTRYVRGGAVCGWLSITGSSIGGGVNSERDTRTLAWRGGYGHPHPSVWQAPLRLWSRTIIQPLRSHNQLCHQLSEACLGP